MGSFSKLYSYQIVNTIRNIPGDEVAMRERKSRENVR